MSKSMNVYPCSSFSRVCSEEFKHEALRQLSYGRSLEEVSQLMSVSKKLLSHWLSKTNSVPLTPPQMALASRTRKKRGAYPDAVKQQALDRLQAGQPVVEVALSMGVPMLLIYRWQDKAQG